MRDIKSKNGTCLLIQHVGLKQVNNFSGNGVDWHFFAATLAWLSGLRPAPISGETLFWELNS